MLNWLVRKIMEHAVKKDIAKDKNFQKEMVDYDAKIKKLNEEIEENIKDIESRYGPVKRNAKF